MPYFHGLRSKYEFIHPEEYGAAYQVGYDSGYNNGYSFTGSPQFDAAAAAGDNDAFDDVQPTRQESSTDSPPVNNYSPHYDTTSHIYR